jgi:hypothetical protein
MGAAPSRNRIKEEPLAITQSAFLCASGQSPQTRDTKAPFAALIQKLAKATYLFARESGYVSFITETL